MSVAKLPPWIAFGADGAAVNSSARKHNSEVVQLTRYWSESIGMMKTDDRKIGPKLKIITQVKFEYYEYDMMI